MDICWRSFLQCVAASFHPTIYGKHLKYFPLVDLILGPWYWQGMRRQNKKIKTSKLENHRHVNYNALLVACRSRLFLSVVCCCFLAAIITFWNKSAEQKGFKNRSIGQFRTSQKLRRPVHLLLHETVGHMMWTNWLWFPVSSRRSGAAA